LQLSRREELNLFIQRLSPEERAIELSKLSDAEFYTAFEDPYAWDWLLRPDQLKLVDPKLKWRFYLLHAGRGWGKSLAANYWLANKLNTSKPGEEVGVIGLNLNTARNNVLWNDYHGLLNRFESYLPKLTREVEKDGIYEFDNGVTMRVFSAAEPDNIRGGNMVAFLLDEFFFYHDARYVLDSVVKHAVRMSKRPQIVISSTPHAVKTGSYAQELLTRKGWVVQGGTLFDNRALSEEYILGETKETYTRADREDMFGEFLTDMGGVFRSEDLKHLHGVKPEEFARECDRVILTLDAAGSSNSFAGIIVAGLKRQIDEQGQAKLDANGKPLEPLVYIIADCTTNGQTAVWSNAVANAVEKYGVHQVILENNHGGDMIKHALRTVAPNLPIKEINAQKSKEARAYPVANLYATGRIIHVGILQQLEDQMLEFDPEHNRNSPDRVDALVHAVTELAVSAKSAPPKPFNMPQMWF
jgi:phage terminase large subunit-like protein